MYEIVHRAPNHRQSRQQSALSPVPPCTLPVELMSLAASISWLSSDTGHRRPPGTVTGHFSHSGTFAPGHQCGVMVRAVDSRLRGRGFEYRLFPLLDNKPVIDRRFRPRCCHLGSYLKHRKSSPVRPLACNWYYCAQFIAKPKAACALRFSWAATSSNLGL